MTAAITAVAAISGSWLGGANAERVARLQLESESQRSITDARRRVYTRAISHIYSTVFTARQLAFVDSTSRREVEAAQIGLEDELAEIFDLAGELSLYETEEARDVIQPVLQQIVRGIAKLQGASFEEWPHVLGRILSKEIDLNEFVNRARVELGLRPLAGIEGPSGG